ncbi:MAG TPA: arginine--tRNA ligase [Bacteroidia bacterium]|nr:arginine--tRNA ligase [Bacteroidia bacterium]
MVFEQELTDWVIKGFPDLFGKSVQRENVSFQLTRKEFEGDLTLVVFSLTKFSGKAPEETAKLLGKYLVSQSGIVSDYNVIKGFLNLSIDNKLWLSKLQSVMNTPDNRLEKSMKADSDKPVLLEYSSPNTNKPLHLGHIRNNLLGYSVSRILQANGNKVVKVNVVNDRGIHICKSMLAWKKYGNGETPESSGMKGDHLVGKYYVLFDKYYKDEIRALTASGMDEKEAEKQAPLMKEAQQMLLNWEHGDPDTLALWKMMNGWVYKGFDITYKRLGVDFDKIYYESDTYLLGKEIVDQGLKKGVFYSKPDGSVWIDLTSEGLDEKLVRRSDGTSVYMTQDLGTALKRFEEYNFSSHLYVVGNEQDYHFKVLFLILEKLGYSWASTMHHLSYNMVDLPSGKMKSREGTVVDADDLMDQMISEAARITGELGKTSDLSAAESQNLYEQIGMGALKYFILKVDPQKRMLFDPAESIDFNGNTGPFIQYTFARIKSVLRKAGTENQLSDYSRASVSDYSGLNTKEKELIKVILRFPDELNEAAIKYSPAVVANYTYELAKTFNQFYHEYSIADVSQIDTSQFRLNLASETAKLIEKASGLLGISVPERM